MMHGQANHTENGRGFLRTGDRTTVMQQPDDVTPMSWLLENRYNRN